MSRMVDDEPPIKSHPASKEYLENWERIFGEGPEITEMPPGGLPLKRDDKSKDFCSRACLQGECGICGATDHERVEAFGGTVSGCPQVPDGYMVALPPKEAVREYLAAGGEPSPIGWYGVVNIGEPRVAEAGNTQITEPGFVEAARAAEKPWERRAIERSKECSTCGAKDEAPCDDDIHDATGMPYER